MLCPKESELKKKVVEIIDLLEKIHPDAKLALRWSNPLELLVATILSAQCTDERVNRVTEHLFKKYRTAEDYANANLEEFEQDIRSISFYRSKARNIKK
ncbi:endonuclease III, partial [Candidatus Bathyarchaeota archaeon]|nr:endonuclease III [Candidatus Bathyarchaeota archaeon]